MNDRVVEAVVQDHETIAMLRVHKIGISAKIDAAFAGTNRQEPPNKAVDETCHEAHRPALR